jgi:hypothetical protein
MKEDAQKEIDRLNRAYLLLNNSLSECAKTGKKYLDETEELEAKIEAAKPILDRIIEKCQDSNDVKTCEDCRDQKCCEEYELKTTLYIPRKEECKHTFEKQEIGKGNPPMYEMACSKCGIWERYVKKENTTP